MNGQIDLKDGFCVSCGRESGAVYRSCPFCDELVWHPLWRRLLRWYMTMLLPAGVLILLALDNSSVVNVLKAYLDTGWYLQILIAISAGVLLLPYENRSLILPSERSRILWLLNSLAASVILLLCALLFAVELRYLSSFPPIRLLLASVALTGAFAPLVMNCNWWHLIPACTLAFGMVFA